MPTWTRLIRASEVPPAASREVVCEGRVVALFNVDGTFYALDGVCPHQGGPLGLGKVEDCRVTCPWHGWQFDLRTGQHLLSATIKQPRFDLRVEDDWILINLG